MAVLMDHSWPGNVRELQNVLERAVIVANGGVPRPADLLMTPATLPVRSHPTREPEPLLPLAKMEERHLRVALDAHDGNLVRSAQTLGISVSTLKRRLKGMRLRDADQNGPQ